MVTCNESLRLAHISTYREVICKGIRRVGNQSRVIGITAPACDDTNITIFWGVTTAGFWTLLGWDDDTIEGQYSRECGASPSENHILDCSGHDIQKVIAESCCDSPDYHPGAWFGVKYLLWTESIFLSVFFFLTENWNRWAKIGITGKLSTPSRINILHHVVWSSY